MDFLKDYSQKKSEEFVLTLGGRYEAYVSDKFIIAYLVDGFYKKYFEMKKAGLEDMEISLTGVAYHSSINLFEHLLENCCGVIMNGHHVAQSYAMTYTEHFTEEDLK